MERAEDRKGKDMQKKKGKNMIIVEEGGYYNHRNYNWTCCHIFTQLRAE